MIYDVKACLCGWSRDAKFFLFYVGVFSYFSSFRFFFFRSSHIYIYCVVDNNTSLGLVCTKHYLTCRGALCSDHQHVYYYYYYFF